MINFIKIVGNNLKNYKLLTKNTMLLTFMLVPEDKKEVIRQRSLRRYYKVKCK